MSGPQHLPPASPPQRPRLTPTRVIVWVGVSAIGLFLFVTGAIGILEKG